jgi:hypothetical protein
MANDPWIYVLLKLLWSLITAVLKIVSFLTFLPIYLWHTITRGVVVSAEERSDSWVFAAVTFPVRFVLGMGQPALYIGLLVLSFIGG